MKYLFIHSMTAISATIFLVSVHWTLITTRILECMTELQFAQACAFSVVMGLLDLAHSGAQPQHAGGICRHRATRGVHEMSVSLSLKNICRRFIKDNEEFMAVNNVNLHVQTWLLVTFLGPSGCGKTTTLRMIAGFGTPTSGQILVDGVDITNVPAN